MRTTTSRVSALVAAILAVAGIAAAAWAFHGVRGGTSGTGRCAGRQGLGRVAYLRGGDLHVVDLARCRDRTLATGASAPVRWSRDGRFVAFGRASVVSARGGRVRHPIGTASNRWAWSPAADELAGVTSKGGVVLGGPGRGPSRLLPSGWGATGVAFDPSGRTLAVSRRSGVWRLDVSTGDTAPVHRVPANRVAPPVLDGWSPDGRWILFWPDFQGSASLAADGLPLEAVHASGGNPVPIATTLVYDDFVTSCGARLVMAAGGGRSVTSGKRIVDAGPWRWSPARVGGDAGRSWFWPACSPDGARIAATSTANSEEHRFDAADRSIWLLQPGRSARRLIGRGGDGVSDEFPRWSGDGRWILFVRHATRSRAPAELVLARVEGWTARVVGPVARLAPQLGFYGHDDWSSATDWYRP
jgi:dipeptidyl aminopeptidase/acylaminoacyl peptidase